MNFKLLLPLLFFSFVHSADKQSLDTVDTVDTVDVCEEHNEKFDLFISCLKINNYDYNVCRNFYNELDWEEWTVNNCYFTLHLPRH
jgi:hypothetical protein